MDSNDSNNQEGAAEATLPASGSLIMPPWTRPAPLCVTHDPGLYVMNSLTRQKDHFMTMQGDQHVTWYMCGPTVYAESHMGHARTYLSFDILRRIMTSYFGYQVTLVMNITDMDDKIIERSLERNMHHLELTRQYEDEFHVGMKALGVAPPTVITRVTEYMDEIVAYIAHIVDKQLAYESNGSVYFDVQAFEATPHMHYCKLAPEQVHNAALLAEGEGKLTQGYVSDKKSPRDFALWKASKTNEPQWASPWGMGRPGWHIECSAMAADMLTKLTGTPIMDVHSGGVDLKFPHHDNEMAQAEAHCGCSQWVNYFVHAGHLHIQGLKMSKSLKNFITIQQALEFHSARQIRLLFLLHKYNASMDYGDNTMTHALETEKRLVEFFHNAKALLRQHDLNVRQVWNADAVELQRKLQHSMAVVDAAIKDDFDTPTVLTVLVELVKATNVYMDKDDVVALVVRNVATFITRILDVFGLNGLPDLGFGDATDNGGATAASREETLAPILDALLDFRRAVRDKARANDVEGVLSLCDAFRDTQLPPLGIRLEDKSGGKSMWKLADPADLLREMEHKRVEAERKAEEKATQAAEAAKKDELVRLPPTDFLRQLTLEDDTTPTYANFGDDGLPTHDGQGEPLNKNQTKKVQKLFKTQQAKYEKWCKSQNGRDGDGVASNGHAN